MTAFLLLDQNRETIINCIEWDEDSPIDHIDQSLLKKADGNIGWKWDEENQIAFDPNPAPTPAFDLNPAPAPKRPTPTVNQKMNVIE